MDLFDYVKQLFKSGSDWNQISDSVKESNFYMLQKFMSIKFPIQANSFNLLKINTAVASDCWRRVGVKFGSTPSWIWTKTAEPKTKDWKPSPALIKDYCKIHRVGTEDFKTMLKFTKKELYQELQKLEAVINVYEKR